jgi:hypothetical protein
VYKQVPHFLNCCNQMLCTVYAKLWVGMFAHSSSLNICRSKEKKHRQNLKWHTIVGARMQMELESKWNSYVKCKQEKDSKKMLRDEIFTWTMNPPHCLPSECQKLNQLPNSWTLASKTTFDKSHQQRIRAYRLSTSPRDFVPLYWWQRKMCWPSNSNLLNCLVCLSNNWI